MSENTTIEWADHTFNPWLGCTKVGPGCDHCYAEADFDKRRHVVQWGAGQPRKRTAISNWALPKRWNAKAAAKGRRFRVFCASLADVFDNEVPEHWRWDLFRLIAATPHLDWLLLTKRIGNAPAMLNSAAAAVAGEFVGALEWDRAPWPNVWIGATVVNQAEADRDIPKLRTVPATVRFLSIEPMLSSVDIFSRAIVCSEANGNDPRRVGQAWIDWVICGGESGPNARPMHPDWARGLRDQCAASGVPFLFKQWGEWVSRGPESMGYPVIDGVPRIRLTDAGHNGQSLGAKGGNDCWVQRAGKKAAGRLLDGVEHNGFPKGGAA